MFSSTQPPHAFLSTEPYYRGRTHNTLPPQAKEGRHETMVIDIAKFLCCQSRRFLRGALQKLHLDAVLCQLLSIRLLSLLSRAAITADLTLGCEGTYEWQPLKYGI